MVWKGGAKSSRAYKMDYFRQSKEENNNPGVVKPHYRKKPKGGFTTVRAYRK